MRKDLIPSLWLGLGLATGLTAAIGFQSLQAAVTNECRKEFSLLNPRRGCGISFPLQREYDVLQNDIAEFIEDLQKTEPELQVSVYFRDLYSGPTFGINERMRFAPASLLKVPLLIAALHIADSNPAFLDQKVKFEGNMDDVENVEDPNKTIQPNTEYTIRDLLRYMIVYSDNRSTQILKGSLNQVSSTIVDDTFTKLGIVLTEENGEDHMTVKNYISIFRILYNGSFLSPEMSQLGLSLLVQSDFKEGLRSAIPTDIPIAHKFGIFSTDGGEGAQLHDCGIVYRPSMHYMLCIMTRSKSMTENVRIIHVIAKTIDEEVAKRIAEQEAAGSKANSEEFSH